MEFATHFDPLWFVDSKNMKPMDRVHALHKLQKVSVGPAVRKRLRQPDGGRQDEKFSDCCLLYYYILFYFLMLSRPASIVVKLSRPQKRQFAKSHT